MEKIFSQLSLKHVFSIFTFATIVLLVVVIFFAGKQYILYRQCDSLVRSSQHLLFQFTGIKEHINESLLQGNSLNSAEIIHEIRTLDDDLSMILDDVLIPEEFKLNFISQVDLVNLTVSIRSIKTINTVSGPRELTKLTSQLRTIHAKLTAFNQLISRYTQKQLLGLHRALVGLLAMTIAIVSIMLLVINQYVTSPIISYCRRAFPEEKNSVTLFTLHKVIKNMAETPDKTYGVETSSKNREEMSRLYRNSSIGNLLGGISNELTNRANGIINYTQALLDLSKDLQLDPDSEVLLKKLFIEEKKMAELISHTLQFTGGSEIAMSRTLDAIFVHISALVEGTFKNDRINLHIDMMDPTRILNYHVSDLQLVILSALQSSRIALNGNDNMATSANDKNIRIFFNEEKIAENRVVIQIEDNGSPWKQNSTQTADASKRPWHNMNFCNDFLHTFGGRLQVSREINQNLCVIDIPLSGDVAAQSKKEIKYV